MREWPARILRILTIAMLAPGFATRAHAQMIQNEFPADIPGYSPSLSDSVVNRMLLEDQNQGVEFNSFIFRPSVSENDGYNSSTLGVPGSGSFEANTAASLRVNSDWSRHALGASLGVNRAQYLDKPVASYTTWNAAIGGALNLGNDTATLSYSHLVRDLTATDLGVAGVVAPVPYAVDDIRASYVKLFSRFSLTPSFDYQTYAFGQAAGAVPVNDHRLNHEIESGSLAARYDFTPGDAAVLILRVSRAEFGLQPLNNYNDDAVFAGLDSRGPQLVQYRALAGFESRRFANAGTSVDTPVFELDTVWTPTQPDTVTLTGFRSLDNPTTPFALNQTVTQGRLQLDHALRQDVFLRAEFGYGLTQERIFSGRASGEQQRQLNFGLAAFWNFNRNMRATLSYNYSSGTATGLSNNLSRTGFSSFTDNTIIIGISFFE
jgi:hypothetical protein